MSQKNKFRFLVCFLFSTVAHSGVLVASLFFQQQIVQDPEGATLKQAANAMLSAPQQLHTVELVDLKESKIGVKGAPQVADLTKTLPQKSESSSERQILLAKDDDPTAVEIKKPTPTKKPEDEKVKPKKEKKKVAKTEKKKKTVAAKKPEPKTEELQDDVVVAKEEELVPVKDHVDAQAKPVDEAEEVAPAPIFEEPAPAPRKVVEAPPVKEEYAEDMAAQTQAQPQTQEFAKPAVQAPKQLAQQPSRGIANGGVAGGDEFTTAGGAASGIRDGDSLVEIAGNVRPVYPVEDRRARREGTAVFVARVTPDGRVTDIKLENAATNSMNAAALKAFANYHYKTGQQGMIRKKFVFKINGEAEEAARLRRTSQYSQPTTSW